MVTSICKLEQGNAQCRYLATTNKDTFHCLKIDPLLQKIIDGETEMLTKYLLNTGKADKVPLAVNCDGYTPAL